MKSDQFLSTESLQEEADHEKGTSEGDGTKQSNLNAKLWLVYAWP